jgi:hypothetical protein
MQKQYTQMVDSLKVLEKAGLSASIYTQPFDVESEQNGLMTYDREIIKLPAATIRNIHAALWPSTGNYLAATKNFTAAVAPAIGEDYATRLQEYKAGKKDSAFLRNLTIVANSQKDKETVNSAASDYVRQLRNPFAETNLRFIQRFTKSSKGAGFPILFNNMEKVNSIIGKNQAEGAIRSVIGKEEIEPYLADKNVAPDWAKINATVKAKYGAIGEEKAHGAQMAYYADKQDWVNFGKYYALYYQTATTRSEYHINNISWSVFEHVTDPEVLAVAVKAAQYSMETFAKNDPNDIDTYANLLYKVGRKQEAIEAEQRAVHLSNNEKTFVETLDKMQKGLPTWN